MNTRPFFAFCALLALVGCHPSEPLAKESAAPAAKPDAKETEGLKLTKEAQELSGIQTATLEAATQTDSVRAFGRVLDPGTLVQQLSDLAVARAASDASAKDFERTRKLNTLGENTSAHALEVAEATARRDALAVQLAQQKIVAAWGPKLAERDDLLALSERLVRQDAALIRLDLVPGQFLATAPAAISLSVPGQTRQTWSAEFMGFATTADPQSQTQGVIALVPSTPPPVGLAVIGQLSTGGETRKGVRVPRAALVHFGDGTFVYVQKTPEIFERHAIVLDGEIGDDVFVTEGVSTGDHVVIVGAQQLSSEELKGSMPAAD